MSEAFDKNRIIKNSSTLFIRMMFTMVLNLLTTRFVLAALGVEDMGVYGIVGSIVGMFGILVSGLLSATQRFITFELGKPDGDVNKVFCTSVNLILFMGIIMLMALEVGGGLMFEYGIQIPEKSIDAARWVMQFSIVTCVLNILLTPYSALLIAHEKMDTWALISVFQVAAGCGMAYSLTLFAQSERLFWYALLAMVIQMIVILMYVIYCNVKYQESHYKAYIDRPLVKEMARFAGASYGKGILEMVCNQGIILVINWTFGVAINAVYNIGMQVKNSVLSFGFNVHKSMAPQITKTYAAGEIDRHVKLVFTSSKFSVYILLLVFIPFLLRADYFMSLWLGKVPPYATIFTSILVFQSLLYAGFESFRTSVMATGKVGKFFIYSESFHLMVLPISYWVAYLTDSPIFFIISVVICDFAYCGYMIYLGTRVTPISAKGFFMKTILPCSLVLVFASIIMYGINLIIPASFLGLCLVIIINAIIVIGIIYTLGLDQREKQLCLEMLLKIIAKIKKQ